MVVHKRILEVRKIADKWASRVIEPSHSLECIPHLSVRQESLYYIYFILYIYGIKNLCNYICAGSALPQQLLESVLFILSLNVRAKIYLYPV